MSVRTLGPNEDEFSEGFTSIRERNEGPTRRPLVDRTISASGGFVSLQMVREPDTRPYASEETVPRRG